MRNPEIIFPYLGSIAKAVDEVSTPEAQHSLLGFHAAKAVSNALKKTK